jgi:hypothetical protein
LLARLAALAGLAVLTLAGLAALLLLALAALPRLTALALSGLIALLILLIHIICHKYFLLSNTGLPAPSEFNRQKLVAANDCQGWEKFVNPVVQFW